MSKMAAAFYGDNPAPRRVKYRETSRRAWRKFVPHTAELDREIMETIEAAGADGIICADIERETGRLHQAVSGNLRHLVERNLVTASGRHGLTPSKRKAIKWRLA